MRGKLKTRVSTPGLNMLKKKSPQGFQRAQEKAAIQLLTWMNTGSGGAKSSRKPPIRFGVLRGSSSAFVGGKHVGDYPQMVKPGTEEKPSPARSYSGKKGVITLVWNTEYATKMHEGEYNLGPFSTQDGDAGPKWIEDHLAKDRDVFSKLMATLVRKELNL